MLKFTQGDLFDSSAQALVNPVNTVGVMGAGLAKEFKLRFPLNFALYAGACSKGLVKTGSMFITQVEGASAQWIVNFPTKQHWRDRSKLEWIRAGLVDLRRFIEKNSVDSIAIPALGAGLGGLPWCAVKREIENAFDGCSSSIFCFEPKEIILCQ